MYCEDDVYASLEEDVPDMELTILGEVGHNRPGSPSQEPSG